MVVDRSYSPYEVIRAYHDRGMMKWGAFSTGELREAENRFLKDTKKDKELQRQPYSKVFHLLNRSFGNQVQIKIQYQSSEKINQIYGFVSEFVDIHQVRVKSTNKIYLIKIEEILNIFSIDDIL